MVRENVALSFEEYFWRDIDLNGKVVLDAGTGFGLTTAEIARRIYQQKHKGTIISVDIDPEAFDQARKTLQAQTLLDLVTFVKADLSNMLERESESIDIVISTRTLADINSSSCRLIRAIAEFYRILKPNRQVVLSDEYPLLTARNQEETVAVKRWQLVKALSHLTGRPHANEVEPEDLESTMRLPGFRECRWAVFKGEKLTERRINHFVERSTEMTTHIESQKLKKAFEEEIHNIRKILNKQGGILPPRYILHAKK